jgi:hypothetical protein
MGLPEYSCTTIVTQAARTESAAAAALAERLEELEQQRVRSPS